MKCNLNLLLLLLAALLLGTNAGFLENADAAARHISDDELGSVDMDSDDETADEQAEAEDSSDDSAESSDAGGEEDGDSEDASEDDVKSDAEEEAMAAKENAELVAQGKRAQDAEAQVESAESSRIAKELADAQSQVANVDNDISSMTKAHGATKSLIVANIAHGSAAQKTAKAKAVDDDEESEASDQGDESEEAADNSPQEDENDSADEEAPAEKVDGAFVSVAKKTVAPTATPKEGKAAGLVHPTNNGAFLQFAADEDGTEEDVEEDEEHDGEASRTNDAGGSEEASQDSSMSEDVGEKEPPAVSSEEEDIGLSQLTELDGSDAEADAIAKMAMAKNPDEALEQEMNQNGEGDANGEYDGLSSSDLEF